MTNPLLSIFTLPPFAAIRPEHIVPAVTQRIAECKIMVKKIIIEHSVATNKPIPTYTWDNLVQPLTEVNNRLHCLLSPIKHLNSVKNTPEFRKAYEKILPLLSEYTTWLGQNTSIFRAYCKLKDSNHYLILNTSQKKAIDNTIRDFIHSGVELSKKQKKIYSKIIKRLTELETSYSNNVLDATIGWNKFITDKKQLFGIPENTLKYAKEKAKLRGKTGWLLTLDTSSYLSIITYSDNQELRKEIYWAYLTRASDQGPNANKWDNTDIMFEELTLRHEMAKLLGFNSYADISLNTKMANGIFQVMHFLNDLLKYVRPKVEKELIKLFTFAKKEYGISKLNPWDINYYSEKQKEYLYDISNEHIRQYFPIEQVLNGLFKVVNRIYGITVKERNNIDVYHPDIRFFDLFEDNNENVKGSFYLDLYIRENKRSGAWMEDCIGHMRKSDGTLQKPVAYLVCNFNPSISDEPVLLTHDEVITLFHEFGHGLHHLLTSVEAIDVSGINGVPWDAVEFPSQFMENWCWEPEALAFISGHYKTHQPLPKDLLKKMIATKNYHSSLFILRQIELSLFDFRLHAEFDPMKSNHILQMLKEITKQIAVIPSPDWNRFPHTFTHIFSGGYAAGYYSYLWANVLAADAYSRFKEEGIFNREVGCSFLHNILMRGGSEEPIELFRRFRGRDPQLQAMLKYYGISIN